MFAAVYKAIRFTNILIYMGIAEAVFGFAGLVFTNISIGILDILTFMPVAAAVIHIIQLADCIPDMIACITGRWLACLRFTDISRGIFNILTHGSMLAAVQNIIRFADIIIRMIIAAARLGFAGLVFTNVFGSIRNVLTFGSMAPAVIH